MAVAFGRSTFGRAAFGRRTGAVVCGLAALLVAATGCGGGGEAQQSGGRGGGTGAGGMGGTMIMVDGGNPEKPLKQIGETCGTASDCGSMQCVEGVCCDKACDQACFTCKIPGSEGTCLPAFQGTDPGDRCLTTSPDTCGTTGVCDGTGACERFSGNAGVICAQESCAGHMRTTTGTCDSAGNCSGAITQPCTPYQCAIDGKTCRTNCSTDADCVSPNSCINGSCGPKPIGAPCGGDDECNSKICAQGRCCMTTCTGTCKSCAVGGSEGTCKNVPDGMDPGGQCTDGTAATCGLDGQCDGAGACRKYAVGTVCGADSCMAGAQMVAGRCDASGKCAAGMLKSCSPYICGATTCKTSCAGNSDCVTGFSCVGSVCVQKSNGSTCTNANECSSGYCEGGICCNTGCAATCMTCATGTCVAVAANTAPTPASQCTDMGSTAPCGTNGKCNGAGACQYYGIGTPCGSGTCMGSTLYSARSCDGAGACRPATTSPCDPYQCGATACKMTCTATATDCTTGNTCVANSCGKIPNGGSCPSGLDADCAQGHCVNKICCNTACAGTCMSCSITGSVGTCSPIPAGTAPLVASQCAMTAASTCGTDGTCDGAGGCRKYVTGTQCGAPACMDATTGLSKRSCDGAGVCGAASALPCGKYTCDMTAGACRTTCTAATSATDCVAPNICNGTSCTLKPIGTTCTAAGECDSGFCAQGYCCDQACTGTCKSCALSGKLGTCSNVANGSAPNPPSQCATTVSTTCGTDGMCNGAGACRFWASTTQCATPSCVGSTLTPPRLCDGTGVCKTVTTSLCDPYVCDPAAPPTAPACKMTCGSTADCVSPNSCVGTSCGKLPDGQPCTTATQCLHSNCAQKVCCATTCAGNCASCALTGSAGTCISVPAGQDPLDQCTDQGRATCGTDGTCDGGGGCRRYASGTICVDPTCTGSTLTPAATCNTSNACVTPSTQPCSPYVCGTNACKTTCSTNADCVGPTFICTGTTCGSATNVSVQVAMRELMANDQAVMPDFKLFNNGSTAIPLSEMTLRYWYTIDTNVAQTAWLDFAAVGNGNVVLTLVPVSPVRTNADFYLQVGFTAAAGNLAAGANTSNVQTRFNKNDFSNYMEANDYSYTASGTFMTTTKVTAYRLGNLVYGTEPAVVVTDGGAGQ